MGANCNRPPDSRCAFESCVRGGLNQPRAVRRITYEHERRPVASRQKEKDGDGRLDSEAGHSRARTLLNDTVIVLFVIDLAILVTPWI